MKTSRITCLAIATMLTCVGFARAESPVHLDDLAVTAERQARQVLYQTYSMQACGPAAQELKDNAFHMIRLANHIHEVAHVDHHRAHRHGDQFQRQAHLNRDLAELDRRMHEMQAIVLRMKARVATRRSAYGRHRPNSIGVSVGRHFAVSINPQGTSSYHHGSHFRAPSTLDRIEISLARLSETVHHLLEDTNVVCVGRR